MGKYAESETMEWEIKLFKNCNFHCKSKSGLLEPVYFRFTSDASLSDSGFLITWSAVPGVPGCGGLLSQVLIK